MPMLISALISRRLKEEGIQRVLNNNANWAEVSIAHLRVRLVPGQRITGEHIRSLVTSKVGEPTHPNAWGGLTNTLVRQKIIQDTGHTTFATLSTSHSRRMPVWEVI